MKKKYCYICRKPISDRKVNQVIDRYQLTGWEWTWREGYRRIRLHICPACLYMIRAQRYQEDIKAGSRHTGKNS